MIPSKESSSPAAPSIGQILLWTLAGLLIALHLLAPPREAMDQGLDSSNYGTYATFVAEGRQFGTEVIPMAGPLGFILYGHTYAGELFTARLIGEVVFKAGFSALFLYLVFASNRRRLGWICLGFSLLLLPTIDDLTYDFSILIACFVILRSFQGGSKGWALTAALLMGPLALFKGTHLVMVGVMVGATGLFGFTQKQARWACLLLLTTAVTCLVSWMGAGQNPLHLPAYIHHVFDLSTGYNETMGLAPHSVYLISGVTVGFAFLLHWTLTWFSSSLSLLQRFTLLLVALFSFLKWKHGFLRADGHVFIFFTSIAVLTPTVSWVARGGFLATDKTAPPRSRTQFAVATFTLTAAILAACGFWSLRVKSLFVEAVQTIPRNAPYLFAPQNVKSALEAELTANRRDQDIPQIRNEVGADSIDFFGHEQGVLLLNRLNYQPRPMGGGTFNVFTPRLQQINEAYLRREETRPDWQLVKIGFLDYRLPAADDGLTLRALLDLYSPQLMQRDYLLFQRRAAPAEENDPELLVEKPFRMGETIPLPRVAPDKMILFSLQSSLSPWGKLQQTFYQGPEIFIRLNLSESGIRRTYAIKPLTLRMPVILSPVIDSNRDLIRLLGGDSGMLVESISFQGSPGFATDDLRVSFYQVDRPLPPEGTDISEIETYAEHPLFNREPSNYTSEETGIKELNKEEIRIVHAPGSITWDLRPQDQQLIFSYGMMPNTYLREPLSDGVEFNVEILWPDGDGRILWQRMMRPVRVPGDRGMQRVRIPLPPYETGAQIRIRTHPGQDNDGASDQSYITRMQIKSGPLIGAQFSGLGVVPTNQLLPRDSVAGIGDHPVYLLHAPNEVRIPLPPAARNLRLQSGLLPGAYENGGNSDGVEFGVFALLPDGEKKYLGGWLLNPRDEATHRGPQSHLIEIPALPSDTQIIVATNVGPHGDRSWDQSYVSNLVFE